MTQQTLKFLVIGGGQQGKVVASQLAMIDNSKVILADQRKDLKHPDPKVDIAYFDATDVTKGYRSILGNWFNTFDVVVSCLPSQFGGPCVQLAAESGANYVDLSFTTDNLFSLDPLAKHTGSTIITDCGLAPGLPNFLSGRILHDFAGGKGEKLPPLDIYVGGVAKDPTLPLGYVETWSLEDLYEEYVRPARYVEDGKELRCLPTSNTAQKHVEINGTNFEAFTSDGLRTLLAFQGVIPNMREWTLRYPGHMAEVKEMLYGVRVDEQHREAIPKEEWVNVFRDKLAPQARIGGSELDTVFLGVECAGRKYTLQADGDVDLTAMAKTTAYTCAVMAEFLAHQLPYFKRNRQRGVMSMEQVGSSDYSFTRVMKLLSSKGLYIFTDGIPPLDAVDFEDVLSPQDYFK